jgi:hypothetical protein
MLQATEQQLLDAIEIISNHLLWDGAFCGSAEGRRLQAISRQLFPAKPTETRDERQQLVTRNLSLPIGLDGAVSRAATKAGISRDALIERSLAAYIDRD